MPGGGVRALGRGWLGVNLFLLLALGAIWGSSFLFIKIVVTEVSVLTFVAWRLVLTSVVLWLLLLFRRETIPRSRLVWASFAVMGLLGGLLPYALISWGEVHISSGLAALLQATMPLFTVVLAHFLSPDERMTPLRISGVIIGFGGVGLLLLPDLRQGLHATLLGQLAVVLASLCYAGTSVFARRCLRGQSPLASTAGQMTTGALVALPLAMMLEQPFQISPSLPALASWLALALLGTVVAYVLYYTLLRRTSATFASMVTYLVPVNGLMLGALVLDEPLSGNIVLSLALILLSLFLVGR